MSKKIAIIASSLHPFLQRHLIEWGEDVVREVPNSRFFVGSKTIEVPYAFNYKLNSKKEYLQNYIRYPIRFLNTGSYLQSIWPLKQFNPDVIHLLTSNAFPKIKDYLQFHKPSLIVGFRGFDINVFPQKSTENLELTREIFDAADIMQFVSEKLMATAISLGADRKKCIVKNRSLRIKDLEVKNTNITPVILSVGRLVWQKGYFFALKAIQILKQSGLDFEYHIIGDGMDADMIRFYINYFDIKNNVVLLGSRNRKEVFRKMQESDIFLQTSVSEGLPLTILEASLMGLPVVSTSIGGIPEAVVHENTGLLSDVCNSIKIAESLENLIIDGNLREQLGKNGHQFIKENFSREKDIEDWKRIYYSL